MGTVSYQKIMIRGLWKVDVIREFAVLEKRDRSIVLSWAHQLPVL